MDDEEATALDVVRREDGRWVVRDDRGEELSVHPNEAGAGPNACAWPKPANAPTRILITTTTLGSVPRTTLHRQRRQLTRHRSPQEAGIPGRTAVRDAPDAGRCQVSSTSSNALTTSTTMPMSHGP